MLTSKFGIWSIKRGGKSPKRFFGHIIIIPFSMQSVASALIQEVETDFTRAAVGALPSERDKADRIYCDECLN